MANFEYESSKLSIFVVIIAHYRVDVHERRLYWGVYGDMVA